MDILEYYETLCINKTATIDEIKYAYRQLCLKYHPDKCKSEEAKDKFIKVTEAYNKIIEYKSKYESINFYICMLVHIYKLLKQPQDIILNFSIDICDIYLSKVKKICYTRYDMKGNKENRCFFLELIGIKKQYVIEKEGDYNIMLSDFSNLIINIDIVFENENMHINDCINPYEIYIKKPISIYEYYYGIEEDLKYINGEYLSITGYIPHTMGTTQIITNKGLPDENNLKSNVYIIYEIDTNKCNINERHKNIIKEMFS